MPSSCKVWARKNNLFLPALASAAFGLVAEGLQGCHDRIPVIALNFDDPVLHRPAGSAFLFEFLAQFIEFSLIQEQARHHRDSFASASLGLPADTHRVSLSIHPVSSTITVASSLP